MSCPTRQLADEWERLSAALEQERTLREAYEGAAADLALAGYTEREALRKVVRLLSDKEKR